MTALPLIIDTDTGSDDAVALLLAAASGLGDIRAVTTVAGNVPVETGTRNALISCASEGARLGARADAVAGQGVTRPEALIRAALSPRYARHVTSRESVVAGVRVVEVRVVAPIPVLGLIGPDDRLDVVGRAFLEAQ